MPANNKQLKTTTVTISSGTIPVPMPQVYDAALDDWAAAAGQNGMPHFVVGGSKKVAVTMHNATTTAGNGTTFTPTDGNTELTFTITGTSTSRTIKFYIKDVTSSVLIPVDCFNLADAATYGKTTAGGSDTAPEIWQVSVPVGYSFIARIDAIAGGNASIKGTAVYS
jgi:hypothetical protein